MRAVKWIVVIVIIALAAKVIIPRLKHHTSTPAAAPQTSCAGAAERASETWGSGLRRFINPPYDIAAWTDFRSGVDAQISAAEGECNCAAPSCESVRGALRDLRNLVSEFDAAIRNGSPPPSDAVQRQEAIDNVIAAAK